MNSEKWNWDSNKMPAPGTHLGPRKDHPSPADCVLKEQTTNEQTLMLIKIHLDERDDLHGRYSADEPGEKTSHTLYMIAIPYNHESLQLLAVARHLKLAEKKFDIFAEILLGNTIQA